MQDFGLTRARNFCLESVICLYMIALAWVKSSVSCLGAFLLDNHLEICLQKGSYFAFGEGLLTCLLLDLGIRSGVDMMSGVILACAVEESGARHC